MQKSILIYKIVRTGFFFNLLFTAFKSFENHWLTIYLLN